MALLVGGGGTLQIVGVFLVVKEIASDRKNAKAVLAPLLESEPEPTYAPGLTERDKMMLRFRHELLEQTVRPTRAETRTQIDWVDRALREFIHEELTGSIRTRIWGVTLIVLGLICATVGGTWATLSGSG